MSIPTKPLPAMLFMGILAADWSGLDDLRRALVDRFGPLQIESDWMDFGFTDYYNEELGSPVKRLAMVFTDLVDQARLAEIKLWTNDLEIEKARPDGSRVFNLDPGLLTLERLVLATGKNFAHRIYLGHGIFGDLTLMYKKGGWQAQPWTFADYAHADMQEFLTRVRQVYKQYVDEITGRI